MDKETKQNIVDAVLLASVGAVALYLGIRRISRRANEPSAQEKKDGKAE